MTELEQKVLQSIEQRRLTPLPRSYFLAKRSVFWTLAALSTILGAVSVAMIIYRVADFAQTGGRGFDEMPFDDVAELLPGIWIISFLLFSASAALAVSKTKRGYRYGRVKLIAAAAGVTIALGVLLHGLNVGPVIHSFVLEFSPAYREFTRIPYDDWRRPDQRLLGGEVLSVEGGRSLHLRDFDGREWTVDISSAEIAVADPLEEEGDVAIRGERTGPASFKAQRIDAFD